MNKLVAKVRKHGDHGRTATGCDAAIAPVESGAVEGGEPPGGLVVVGEATTPRPQRPSDRQDVSGGQAPGAWRDERSATSQPIRHSGTYMTYIGSRSMSRQRSG